MTALRPAAFLDRDGTLIEDAHYPSDASAVRLVEGAAAAVRRLNDAGVLTVVVTNQSGIALGLLTVAQYEATRQRLGELLAAHGARIDASYHCPHHPDVSGHCDCRKPGTAMHLRSAGDLGIDVARSLFVGDRWRDVAPGVELGGFALLVPSPDTPEADVARAQRENRLATTLEEAIETYLLNLPR